MEKSMRDIQKEKLQNDLDHLVSACFRWGKGVERGIDTDRIKRKTLAILTSMIEYQYGELTDSDKEWLNGISHLPEDESI
jgi:hypothetical protein